MKPDMRYIKILIGILLLGPFFYSCDSKLDVNAEWKDITVVYGLLNQNDSLHYFKITKAFLGEGNALSFAQIPDSSYYHDSLEVRMEEYIDSQLQPKEFRFETTTEIPKDSGMFFYPYNLLFKTTGALNENAQYKLIIKNRTTGKLITSQTTLIHHFDISKPQMYDQASFLPGFNSKVQWTSAVGGKRYQLVIRFHYLETLISDTSQHSDKYVDWIAFKNLKSPDIAGGRTMDYPIPGDVFYIVVGSQVSESDLYNRLPRDVEYIFSVIGEDMNTYLEVTEPSTGIIQERPAFSNITNGIGLFSSTYDNRRDNPLVLRLSDKTLAELKENPHTINRGF
jgi:hypothetical protein